MGNLLTLAYERAWVDREEGKPDETQSFQDPIMVAWMGLLAEWIGRQLLEWPFDWGVTIKRADAMYRGYTVDIKSSQGRDLHVRNSKNCTSKRCDLYLLISGMWPNGGYPEGWIHARELFVEGNLGKAVQEGLLPPYEMSGYDLHRIRDLEKLEEKNA